MYQLIYLTDQFRLSHQVKRRAEKNINSWFPKFKNHLPTFSENYKKKLWFTKNKLLQTKKIIVWNIFLMLGINPCEIQCQDIKSKKKKLVLEKLINKKMVTIRKKSKLLF